MIRTDVKMGWKSIPGHRHLIEGRENEDAVLTLQEHPYFDALMIVADGMGGHPEPRLAAQTAAAAAREFLSQPERLVELANRRVEVASVLRAGVEYANGRVRRLASRVPSGRGSDKPPGCTLTVAAVADGRLAVAHVGDGSVFLFRDDHLRSLAGGEARRVGSRPEEFLGRSDRLEVEIAVDEARAGDRLLLCTDGLTRYFGGGGASAASGVRERLQQVVARPTADPGALASQLTADGRGEQYEDDTTVIVAEIGASREVPEPRPDEARGQGSGVRGQARQGQERPEGTPPLTPDPSPLTPRFAWLLMLVALLAAGGFSAWRAWQRSDGAAPPPFRSYAAPAVDLSGLPRGGVLLSHPESGRLFALRTRPVAAPASDEPLTLRALRVTPGGGVKDTGNSYRLDAPRGLLTAPNGKSYPVTIDSTTGIIEVQPAGTLRLNTRPPGLRVYIDGFLAGKTPLNNTTVRAGPHQVEIRSASGRLILSDAPVEVPAGWTVTVNVPVPATAPGRVPRR
jgi:serine/threonine protein phosphatase PrpC